MKKLAALCGETSFPVCAILCLLTLTGIVVSIAIITPDVQFIEYVRNIIELYEMSEEFR